MQSAQDQPMPSVIGGRYRVIRELGRGGFGAVYLVEHTNTGDRLALKVLYGAAARDPMSLERFKREARASAKIRSDNVVKITDADAAPELGGAPFLVMELLDGKDVEQLAEERGALLPEEVVGILSQAARALDKAHALGIVHRDLKPENMFLHRREDGSSILKILDFGISKSVGDTGGDMRSAGMTSTGAVLGTPLYMAPEQARGLAAAISPRTDIWAMGLVAHRLLTGDIYWRANTVTDLLVQIVAGEMARPSSQSVLLPPAFDAWFARSCARNPDARFASVGEQIHALAAALGVTAPVIPSTEVAPLSALRPAAAPGISAPQTGRSTGAGLAHTAAATPGKRRPVLWIASGVALVLAASATFVVLGRTMMSPPAPASANAPAVSASAAPESPAAVSPSATSPVSTTSAKASDPVVVPPVPPPVVAPVVGKKTPPKAEVSAPPATRPPPAATPKRFEPDAP